PDNDSAPQGGRGAGGLFLDDLPDRRVLLGPLRLDDPEALDHLAGLREVALDRQQGVELVVAQLAGLLELAAGDRQGGPQLGRAVGLDEMPRQSLDGGEELRLLDLGDLDQRSAREAVEAKPAVAESELLLAVELAGIACG